MSWEIRLKIINGEFKLSKCTVIQSQERLE